MKLDFEIGEQKDCAYDKILWKNNDVKFVCQFSLHFRWNNYRR